MSDLTYLRTFLAVYRHGSVTRAAESLDVAQPTVTSHIKALETKLGRPLFRRRTRGVEPRAAAHELAGVVARHVDALDGVLFGERGRSGRGGVVWVGGPSEFLGSVALPALAPLADRGIRIRAMADVDGPVLAALQEGEIDIAVLTSRHEAAGLEFVVLDDEELVLVAAPDMAATIGPVPVGPRGAELLADERVIAFGEDIPLVRQYWQAVFRVTWGASPGIVINSLPAVAGLARRGMGIAVLPRHVCQTDIDRGTLTPLLEPRTPPRNTLYLGYHAGAAVIPLLSRAIELMRSGDVVRSA